MKSYYFVKNMIRAANADIAKNANAQIKAKSSAYTKNAETIKLMNELTKNADPKSYFFNAKSKTKNNDNTKNMTK